jgi:hypothetical protein
MPEGVHYFPCFWLEYFNFNIGGSGKPLSLSAIVRKHVKTVGKEKSILVLVIQLRGSIVLDTELNKYTRKN